MPWNCRGNAGWNANGKRQMPEASNYREHPKTKCLASLSECCGCRIMPLPLRKKKKGLGQSPQVCEAENPNNGIHQRLFPGPSWSFFDGAGDGSEVLMSTRN
jgi:hypothetical protein